jgi:hypothetical protein
MQHNPYNTCNTTHTIQCDVTNYYHHYWTRKRVIKIPAKKLSLHFITLYTEHAPWGEESGKAIGVMVICGKGSGISLKKHSST